MFVGGFVWDVFNVDKFYGELLMVGLWVMVFGGYL